VRESSVSVTRAEHDLFSLCYMPTEYRPCVILYYWE
jgi:hypothetical protein